MCFHPSFPSFDAMIKRQRSMETEIANQKFTRWNRDIPTRLKVEITEDESGKNLSSVSNRPPGVGRIPEATDRLIKQDVRQPGSHLRAGLTAQFERFSPFSNSGKEEEEEEEDGGGRRGGWSDREVLRPVEAVGVGRSHRNFASHAGICSFDLSFGRDSPFVNR